MDTPKEARELSQRLASFTSRYSLHPYSCQYQRINFTELKYNSLQRLTSAAYKHTIRFLIYITSKSKKISKKSFVNHICQDNLYFLYILHTVKTADNLSDFNRKYCFSVITRNKRTVELAESLHFCCNKHYQQVQHTFYPEFLILSANIIIQ